MDISLLKILRRQKIRPLAGKPEGEVTPHSVQANAEVLNMSKIANIRGLVNKISGIIPDRYSDDVCHPTGMQADNFAEYRRGVDELNARGGHIVLTKPRTLLTLLAQRLTRKRRLARAGSAAEPRQSKFRGITAVSR